MKDILSYAPVAAAMYVEAGFYQYSAGVYTGCPDYDTYCGGNDFYLRKNGNQDSDKTIKKNLTKIH